MDRKTLAPHPVQLTLRIALDVLERCDRSLQDLIVLGRAGRTLEAYAMERYSVPGVAYALMTQDGPVAMGGIQETTPGVAVCWVVCTPAARAYARHLLTLCRKVPLACLRNRFAHRIEAHVRCDDVVGLRFIEHVGFTFEHWAAQASHDRVAMGIFSMIEGRDARAEVPA